MSDFKDITEEQEMKMEHSNDFASNEWPQDHDSLDDITLSQIAENMEKEHYVFTEMGEMSISQTVHQYLTPGDFNLDFTDSESNSWKMETFSYVNSSRFVKPVTNEELKCLVDNQQNVNSKSNTKWAVNVFNKWREQRWDSNIPEFQSMDAETMNYWLQRFIVEARKQNGSEYLPKSLYLIACGLLRHLRDEGVYDKNFMDEDNVNFVGFRKVLDAQMKTLINKELGCTARQADPITRDDEMKLWENRVFGKENGEQLQETVFFYISKLFGLR